MQQGSKTELQLTYASLLKRRETSIILIDRGYQAMEEAEARLRRSLAWLASLKGASEGQRMGQAGPQPSIDKSG